MLSFKYNVVYFWVFSFTVILSKHYSEAKHLNVYGTSANKIFKNYSTVTNEGFNCSNPLNASPCALCFKSVEKPVTSNCYKHGVYHLFSHVDGDGSEKKIYSPITIQPVNIKNNDEWCYIDVTFKDNFERKWAYELKYTEVTV